MAFSALLGAVSSGTWEPKLRNLGWQRLTNLQIAESRCTTPGQVVAALGAMQAQDYAGALWAIGLRMPGSTLIDIERAIADRSIVRSWPLRGTLHFVAAADLRWLLDLLAARAISGSAKRHRDLALDAASFTKAEKLLTRALEGGRQLTRDAIFERLQRAKLSTDSGRGYHMLWRLAQEQVLCFGIPAGKQPTFTLLNEWIPASKRLDRGAALGELARRYFTSHGPATLRDLMRWANINGAEAKLGLEAAAQRLTRDTYHGSDYWLPSQAAAPSRAAGGTFLLPGFDEFLLGYGDRAAVLDPVHAANIVPGGNGVFRPTLVRDGRVIGTWKAVVSKRSARILADPFAPLSKVQQRPLERAAEQYARFLGRAGSDVTCAG